MNVTDKAQCDELEQDGLKSDAVPRSEAATFGELGVVYRSWTSEYRDDLERKLLRKIDWHIMPSLVIIYIMNYMDRTSVTQARLYGIQQDLGISGAVWQTGISILSVPYIISQIPAALLIARTRPSILLPTTMILWAIVSGCTGATTNVAGFFVVRILLGATEGPFFPAAIYFLSCWYRKRELGIRIGFLMSGLVTSQAFAGLVSAGILKGMDGATKIAAWRWLFILEGLATVVFGVIALFVLPNYPHSTRWLTGDEKICAIYRLEDDAGRDAEQDEGSTTIKKGFVLAAQDYRVWLYACMQMSNTACISFSYFFPTLVHELGFTDNTTTLLITAPPYALGFFSIIGLAYYTDRAQVRSSVGMGSMGVAVAATVVTLALRDTNKWVRYAMLFPTVCGIYTCYCITYTWLSSTIVRPREKRAAAIGISNTCANSAVLFGSYMWLDRYAPTFAASWCCILAFGLLSMACSAALRLSLGRANRRFDELAARIDPDDRVQLAALTEDERAAVQSGFRFVI